MPNPEMKTLTVGNNTFDIRDGRVGDLSDLDTTDKSSIVAAINEAAQSGGGSVDPYSSTPADLGTASAGSSDDYARGDHVHNMPSAAQVGAEPATTEVTISTAGAVTQALDAVKIYHFTGALTSLTITLNAAAAGQLAHYHVDFDCGSTAPTVTIPNTVTMPDSNSFEANKHYEVDILNNYGAVMAWATS